MQFSLTFFSAFLAAVFFENIIFTRALGTSRIISVIKSPKTMLKFGVLLTCITTVSGFLAWAVNLLIKDLSFKLYIEPIVFVLVLVVVYVLASIVLLFAFPKTYRKMREILLLAVFNCASLGAVLLPAHNSLMSVEASLASWLGYAFGTGIAFFLASILVFEGTRKLKGSHIPEAFRGLPATLIYIGILSLAFYGLIGHKLPF